MESIVFSQEDLKDDFEDIYDGIQARIIKTGSIELKFTKLLCEELINYWSEAIKMKCKNGCVIKLKSNWRFCPICGELLYDL